MNTHTGLPRGKRHKKYKFPFHHVPSHTISVAPVSNRCIILLLHAGNKDILYKLSFKKTLIFLLTLDKLNNMRLHRRARGWGSASTSVTPSSHKSIPNHPSGRQQDQLALLLTCSPPRNSTCFDLERTTKHEINKHTSMTNSESTVTAAHG